MDAEERAMQNNRTLRLDRCRQLGVGEDFLLEWADGIILEGHEAAPRFHLADYPSVQHHYDRAAEELDRLTQAG